MSATQRDSPPVSRWTAVTLLFAPLILSGAAALLVADIPWPHVVAFVGLALAVTIPASFVAHRLAPRGRR